MERYANYLSFDVVPPYGAVPEQMTHWSWVNDRIAGAGRPLNILNLFAYTGAATLAAAAAGASVTRLDASKKAIQWAKDNQEASGLGDKPIRWICDDAKAFVSRELRRGKTYDGIILENHRNSDAGRTVRGG